ncbi:ABC transporter ATP-binding protein [Niallia sp. HCP3S3_B10]|uniref:ABC transporter ATP-binding protein n=1 Tax=Niallia sp. HCP3S3_B10 TaxID=3438944 RepID=UPI003F8ACF73
MGQLKNNNLLKIENITYSKNNSRIIKNINLTLQKGEVLGIIGPNGSGKSTLFKLITGIYKKNSGNIEVCGNKISSITNELIGHLIEEPKLYSYLSGKEHLNIIQRLKGKKDEEYLDLIIDKLDMKGYLEKKIKNYSLGMRQRLGVASAMIHNPDIILLDEPLNALDIDGVRLVKKIIEEKRRENKGIILSSHLLNEVEEICNKVVIIKGGAIIETIDYKIENKKIYLIIKGESLPVINPKVHIINKDKDSLLVSIERDYFTEFNMLLFKNNIQIIDVQNSLKNLEKIYFETLGGK